MSVLTLVSGRGRWSRVGLMMLATVVALSVLAIGARPATPAPRAGVDSRVAEQMAAKGRATFWAVLRDRADLSAAAGIQDWTARGQYVVDRLKAVAASSQRGLLGLLEARGADHEAYWISNAVLVRAADASLLDAVAARPEVARIVADAPVRLHEARPSDASVATEWGLNKIQAPQVWSEFGVKGEGIIVANVDTGVHWTHPAIRRQYRGVNIDAGTVDHNYNWWNPTGQCGSPNKPCDNSDHGTHTMGTMVGDDGRGNQIGVAPGAKWIAAKGCGTVFCQNSWLLSAGEFILAPTNLQGTMPRPDLRPHVVNNSWGGGGGDTFYKDIVDSWVASGIFPAFSNGNSGPGCQSSGSPGDFANTYSAGAFDINNNIASFSSRGASLFGGILKPNIAAPGVGVRSSVPPNGYALFDGTSMASPHVAGTVALMMSANPALKADILTVALGLDDSAVDHGSTQCGGTTDDNNVWGEGELNALAAVQMTQP